LKRPDRGRFFFVKAFISVTASFVLFGAWTVNLVSYHPAGDLKPLAPLSTNAGWK
jgi:hypothetical protein